MHEVPTLSVQALRAPRRNRYLRPHISVMEDTFRGFDSPAARLRSKLVPGHGPGPAPVTMTSHLPLPSSTPFPAPGTSSRKVDTGTKPSPTGDITSPPKSYKGLLTQVRYVLRLTSSSPLNNPPRRAPPPPSPLPRHPHPHSLIRSFVHSLIRSPVPSLSNPGINKITPLMPALSGCMTLPPSLPPSRHPRFSFFVLFCPYDWIV